jgi:hypothetical protein
MPSNYPWEGVQMFYERLYNLKNKFWKTPLAGFGKLQEFVARIEFQFRGAIHAHYILWVEKNIETMITEDLELGRMENVLKASQLKFPTGHTTNLVTRDILISGLRLIFGLCHTMRNCYCYGKDVVMYSLLPQKVS